MEKTWIVVADSAHARILATTARTAEPTEVSTLVHPGSRLKENDLVTDKPGRSKDSMGQGHAMDESKATEHEEAVFASEIVDTLDEGRQQGKFESLILIAPPKFLGALRAQLSKPLSKQVVQSIDKNLVTHDLKSIRQHLSN